MAKTPTIPNNPFQAYIAGVRQGRQDNFDVVAMALLDKCGFHVKSTDAEDRMSIQFLFETVDSYIDEINAGRISKASVKQMLCDEYDVAFE